MSQRPTTPPATRRRGSLPPNPLTPEQIRRTEEARLGAKALRAEHDANRTAESASAVTGQKRPHSQISSSKPPSDRRDARTSGAATGGMSRPAADDVIRPAKKFEKYIEYDFSTMTDTRGGFLSVDDDPLNKALHSGTGGDDAARHGAEQKPANMTMKEWERQQLLKKLRANRAGPFEPGVSVLNAGDGGRACRECGSPEIDWAWRETFGVGVCGACKEKLPEKYSLLTKSEAREDYLLTDEELRDAALLPHLERPNPHKSTWHSMMLYLRCQVEEYAFGPRKWGSPAALDAEFERREAEKKRRKEAKFKTKLDELKKKTRVEAYRRSRLAGRTDAEGREARFGDRVLGRNERHEHEWGMPVTDPETGVSRKKCVECGMECEELEF